MPNTVVFVLVSSMHAFLLDMQLGGVASVWNIWAHF